MSTTSSSSKEGEGEATELTNLPADILLSISTSLKTYTSYLRFRSTCTHLHTLLPTTPSVLPLQLPWLLLPPFPPSPPSRRRFFDIVSGKTHSLRLPDLSHPPPRICGSSRGWLVVAAGESPGVFCLNPLPSPRRIFLAPLTTLPSVTSFSFSNVGREYSLVDPISRQTYSLDLRQMRDFHIRKVILSHPPMIAIAIVTCHFSGTTELVFSRSTDVDSCTDNSWKSVPVSDFSAEDVICCGDDGLFYAVNKTGDVLVFGITGDVVSSTVTIRTVASVEGDLHYVVKFAEELLLVSRHLVAEADLVAYCEVYVTVRFDVYRFREVGDGRGSWDKVTDLGDRALFVGDSSSLALSASDFDGCKGNAIYFTDDHSNCNDVGVFDLCDGRIELLPCYPIEGNLPMRWAPPIWITPNPC